MIDDHFQLTKILGKGGSSKVFLATDSSQQLVAVKTIRSDKKYSQSAAQALIDREAQTLALLEGHPNILRCLHSNSNGRVVVGAKTESVMYNVLEYAQNGALSTYIRQTGPLEESLARLFAFQVCSAIDHMHSLGLVHLDIKLENILLDEFFNVKVADLGSCVEASEFSGCSDRRRGTAHYMAPEVAGLQPGEAFRATPADVYSLGITMYVMVTGEFPSPHQLKLSVSTTDIDGQSCIESDSDSQSQKSGWSQISPELRKLLQAMMDPEPCKRPLISEVLSSWWFDVEFNQEIMEEAYCEMASRKAYIEKLSM